MTTPNKALELLISLLARGSDAPPKPRFRLPPGRCACHEPTVKWCGRHGEPRKHRTTLVA